jgi:LAGLIDADG endonuclease
MNKILLFDLIYLAGFIDGDGSITAQLVKREDYKWGYQIRLTVQFTQHRKRRIFLEKLKDIIGVGYIRDRDIVSDYVITEPKNVLLLLKLIQPYLRIKQKQANLVITIIEQLPLAKKSKDKFIELSYMIDQVALLNDSKARKITALVVEAHLNTI